MYKRMIKYRSWVITDFSDSNSDYVAESSPYTVAPGRHIPAAAGTTLITPPIPYIPRWGSYHVNLMDFTPIPSGYNPSTLLCMRRINVNFMIDMANLVEGYLGNGTCRFYLLEKRGFGKEYEEHLAANTGHAQVWPQVKGMYRTEYTSRTASGDNPPSYAVNSYQVNFGPKSVILPWPHCQVNDWFKADWKIRWTRKFPDDFPVAQARAQSARYDTTNGVRSATNIIPVNLSWKLKKWWRWNETVGHSCCLVFMIVVPNFSNLTTLDLSVKNSFECASDYRIYTNVEYYMPGV